MCIETLSNVQSKYNKYKVKWESPLAKYTLWVKEKQFQEQPLMDD